MIGSKVKEIRESKGIKPGMVFSGIMDRASYWRFENEGAQSSFEAVYKFLRRININLDEFMAELPGVNAFVYESLIQKQQHLFNTQKIDELEILADEILLLFNETNSLRYEHFYITTKFSICRLKNTPFEKKEVKTIIDYLINCNMWTYYEIRLFSNTMYIFDYQVVPMLFQNAYERIKNYEDVFRTWNEEVSLFTNYMSLAIRHDDRPEVEKLLQRINTDIRLSEKSVYNRIIVKWASNIMLAYLKKDEKYFEIAHKLIETFRTLEMDGVFNLFNTWTDSFKELVLDNQKDLK